MIIIIVIINNNNYLISTHRITQAHSDKCTRCTSDRAWQPFDPAESMVLRPQPCRRDVWSPGQAIVFEGRIWIWSSSDNQTWFAGNIQTSMEDFHCHG